MNNRIMESAPAAGRSGAMCPGRALNREDPHASASGLQGPCPPAARADRAHDARALSGSARARWHDLKEIGRALDINHRTVGNLPRAADAQVRRASTATDLILAPGRLRKVMSNRRLARNGRSPEM